MFSYDTHFGRTEYDLVNMTETVDLTWKDLKIMFKLYNYYSTLATKGMILKLFIRVIYKRTLVVDIDDED